jgi:hypothetical protein
MKLGNCFIDRLAKMRKLTALMRLAPADSGAAALSVPLGAAGAAGGGFAASAISKLIFGKEARKQIANHNKIFMVQQM